MTDFNQAIILGNLTKDPEFRYTPNGQAVASFSIATNRKWTTAEGQQQEDVQFHNVVAWGKLAEICNKILYKGRKTLVVGRIQTRNWEGQDGIKRYTTEIIADQISATGPAKSANEEVIADEAVKPISNNTTKADATSNNENIKPENNKENEEDINLDDIPF